MPLVFRTATTDRVTYGTGLGNYTSVTACAWIYPTTLAAFNAVFQHATSGGGSALGMFIDNATSTELRAVWPRLTAGTSYRTNNAGLTTNRWWFVAVTMNQGGTANALNKIYRGHHAMPVTECTYSETIDGSGTYESPSGWQLYVGNGTNPFDIPWVGQIGTFFLWPNVVLSLGDIRRQQYQQRPVAPGCQLLDVLGRNGAGNVFDESGFGNHGTVTGALPTNFQLPRVRRQRHLWHQPFVPPPVPYLLVAN